MRRAATSVFLAGWIGFLSVSALIGALAILRAAGIGVPPVPGIDAIVAETASTLLSRGNAEILAVTVSTLLQSMIAASLGLALCLLHSRADADHREGERLAVIALGCIGALVAAMHLAGFATFERFGTVGGFGIVVALSILAVLFDRMISVEDDDDPADEAHFRAAVALIGRQMAQGSATGARSDEAPPERQP